MDAPMILRLDSREELERALRASLLLPSDQVPLLILGPDLLADHPSERATAG